MWLYDAVKGVTIIPGLCELCCAHSHKAAVPRKEHGVSPATTAPGEASSALPHLHPDPSPSRHRHNTGGVEAKRGLRIAVL